MSRFNPATLNRLKALEFYVYNEFKTVIDDSGSPGLAYALMGDADCGFLGVVQPSEFGLINGTTVFSNDNLRTEISVGGTNEYGDPNWLKFAFDEKILFVPMKPLSRSISWDQIYDAGCVYGTGDQGILPPKGRLGSELTIEDVGGGVIGIKTTGHFLGDLSGGMDYYDTVGAVGNTIVLADWTSNDGEYEIATITDDTITLVDNPLTPEAGTRTKRLWNKANEVTQNKQVTIAGYTYKVRLLKGAAADPADYASNRGARGPANEWARLILPLHINAITGDWSYSYYDPVEIENWNVGLTDADLITHSNYGLGSYTWVQEARGDNETFRRLRWGGHGASFVGASYSWLTPTNHGFRPVLELL
jgi:hypothetical protein